MRAPGAMRRVAGSLRIFESAFWLRLPWEVWRPRKSLLKEASSVARSYSFRHRRFGALLPGQPPVSCIRASSSSNVSQTCRRDALSS